MLVSLGIILQNVSAEQVVSTIPLGSYPSHVGINPSTNMIYVGQNGGNLLYIINGTTNTLSDTLTIGPSTGYSTVLQIAVNPNTNKIYALTQTGSGGILVVIDGSTNSIVTKIPVSVYNVQGVAVNPNTNKIYVGDIVLHVVYVIDGATNNIVTSVPVTNDPVDIALNPVTNKIYAAIDHSTVVDVIDGSTNTVINHIGVESHSENVAVNPITNRIYVAAAGTAFENPNLYVVDGSTDNVIDVIPKLFSQEMGINPDTNRVYVPYNNTISIINGSTNNLIGTISDGSDPSYAAVNSATNMIYVSNVYGNSVTVIDGRIVASSAPQNLQATATSSSQINLSWTAPSNNGGSAITGYEIERSTDGGSTWSAIVSNTGNTAITYSDTGLTHSTTYTYRVSAINQIGTSQPSNTASATTFNTVPSQPIGLTATAQTLQINLRWNAPSDNGGTPITGYKIERSTNNGNTWSTIVSNTGSTGTTYSDKNILPLTTYTYRVSAINDIGTGNSSNTASASTLSVGPVTPPSLP
ncbi:MAG TPA: fibronectin type III domain-containing protein [Nitrosopumilaceae archaeon]|nr:fibronectin type III domain-containing protein [Nitrosopumilaceae archaeon]